MLAGGFYDHVPPPMQVPKPDDLPSFPDTDFNFTRLGMRIPALLISPLIPKGTVISSPTDAEKPFANSEFELSSVIASVKNIFQSPEPHLTKRDAWAATFDTRLSERTPRTDCPMLMPDAPKSLGEGHAHTEAMQPMNHLQQDIIRAYAHLRGLDLDAMEGGRPRLQGEGAEWISKVVADIF
jgi:phospholipase C